MPPVVVAVIVPIAISLAVSVVLTVATMLLFPPKKPPPPTEAKNNVPKPQDGSFNLKQNVPSIVAILGTVKKGGDYIFLEERRGTAWHVIILAAHRIQGIVKYYLHDEEILAFNAQGGVMVPDHFTADKGLSGGSNVKLLMRYGNDTEGAWGDIVENFPELWTENHRADGLASMLMGCNTVDQEKFQDTYPQGMPVPTAVIQGALLYDPRNPAHNPNFHNSWTFSQNIALMRLWHLTHPIGAKLNINDLYLPDWINAANCCDEQILNGQGVYEARYWGGIWFKAETDPVQIGQKLDEAGELVLYERPDGLIGVHSGKMVLPDIIITADDIQSISIDTNRRLSTTVLAVRGRFTDPNNTYNTVDAAIWGNPYISTDDSQRTSTVDNETIQSHNLCQRIQKLRMIRANAVKVNITIDYDFISVVKDIAYRRFVRVDYPDRGLNNAIVEIIDRPKLSLANLNYTFDGIVVPEDFYAFDSSEEGTPPAVPDTITGTGPPIPTGFGVSIERISLDGYTTVPRAVASWTHVSDKLVYQLQWVPSNHSQPEQNVNSQAGSDQVRSNYLVDGVYYNFYLRSLSNNSYSDWVGPIVLQAIADVNPPDPPVSLSSTNFGLYVRIDWGTSNSVNLSYTSLYRASTNDFSLASVIYTSYTGPGVSDGYNDTTIVIGGGPYFYWVQSFNSSGIPSDVVGPVVQYP
jgi:hypothetical protein